jgi:hypothetical protein
VPVLGVEVVGALDCARLARRTVSRTIVHFTPRIVIVRCRTHLVVGLRRRARDALEVDPHARLVGQVAVVDRRTKFAGSIVGA